MSQYGKLYMFDTHDGETKPNHPAFLVWHNGAREAVAIPLREDMERWLDRSTTVLTLNRVDYRPEPRITRTALHSVTGVQLAELYERGSLQLGERGTYVTLDGSVPRAAAVEP